MGCSQSDIMNPDVEFLKRLKLFSSMSVAELTAVVKLAKTVELEVGKVLLQQGDTTSHACYVLKTGSATAETDGKLVATLKSGDYFGEKGLINDEPQPATITIATKVEALVIKREDFQKLELGSKLTFKPRYVAAGGGQRTSAVQDAVTKTEAESALILKAITDNSVLKSLGALDDTKRKAMCELMWQEKVPADKEVVTIGDKKNNTYFYIIHSGSFSLQEYSFNVPDNEAPIELAKVQIEAGQSFGEASLLGSLGPRRETVKATTEGVLWVLARHQFRDVLMKSGAAVEQGYTKYIKKCETLMKHLKDNEVDQMATGLQEATYSRGQKIFEQWGEDSWFFLLIEGKVIVSVENESVEDTKVEASSENVPGWGEICIRHAGPQEATISVDSDNAKVLWIDKESFELVVGSYDSLVKRGRDGEGVCKRVSAMEMAASMVGMGSDAIGSMASMVAPNAEDIVESMNYEELKPLGQLGCGGFGSVDLVEHLPTGETYALKALNKGFLLKTDSVDSVMAEKDTLLMCNSPFIIKLYETFNRGNYLYMLLEVCLGGEILALYATKAWFGSFAHARFYIAGTIMGYEHLHKRKIIHRDMKPENLLLNSGGYLKITDLGLSKVCPGKTYTTCGTPPYMAPELIGTKGHTIAVDWWALGCVLFELLAGFPPFSGSTAMEIYQKVNRGMEKLPKFPHTVSRDAEHLVRELCKAEPTERLGMKKGGAKNVRAHTWYLDFNWDEFVTFAMRPPYNPRLKSKRSTVAFQANPKGDAPQEPYEDPGNGWDKDFATSPKEKA